MSQTDVVKKDYVSIDVFKLFAAVLVIAIHVKPFQNNFWLDAGVGMLTRMAVPFFFCASAFVLFKSINAKPEAGNRRMRRYCIRLLKLYAIWYVIYALVQQREQFTNLSGWLYLAKQFVFPTNGLVLWFFPGLMIAALLVFYLKKVMKTEYVFGVSIIFLVIGYGFSTVYEGIFSEVAVLKSLHDTVISFIGTQNGLFFGFAYVALGALLAEDKLRCGRKKACVGWVLSYIGLGAEALVAVLVLGSSVNHIWLFALPLTWCVMNVLLSIDMKENPMFKVMRKMSTLVYVLHCFVIMGLERLGVRELDGQNLMLFVLTTVISLGISYLLVLLSEKRTFRFLKIFM